MTDFAECDDCGVEGSPDDLVRVEQPHGADFYRCAACTEKRGEQQDGHLWTAAEYPFVRNL